MKTFLGVLLVVVATAGLIYIFYHLGRAYPQVSLKQNYQAKVCFKDSCFSVELARTNIERERGLKSRDSLEADKGMLFIFENEGVYPFWMQNVLIPLDIIWVDSSNRVVAISNSTPICEEFICPSINPYVGAKYVLEINAGICKQVDLKIGDRLEIDI